MVEVRGSLRLAFSTIVSPNEDFNPEHLKIDSRMFPGRQEKIKLEEKNLKKLSERRIISMVKKIKDKIDQKRLNREGFVPSILTMEGLSPEKIDLIKEKTNIRDLGSFLEKLDKEPNKIADLLGLDSIDELKFYLNLGKESFKNLRTAIKDPSKILEISLTHCIDLFQTPEEDVKSYRANNKEGLLIDPSREFSISFEKRDDIEELKAFEDVDENKKYGYEIQWVMFNVTREKWIERLEKLIITATTSLIKNLVPMIGRLIKSQVKKVVKSKSDDLLIQKCNQDIKRVLYVLLRSNLAIDAIKFEPFKATIWDFEEQKEKIKEFGTKVLQSTEILSKIKNLV
ncbi:MAG: hypothetical protein GF383_04355 [Candidatus Lokiarchaeota archaeon]|nr:hypothetical protein [Candidatus Lokiarchaeota archaeon]MBD3339006.1 hypothetical protein [Candidatus Lokiarchaeota archaeon]